MSFAGATSAIGEQASILTLECCFDEIADGLFEDLRLLDFWTKDLVEFKLLDRCSWTKFRRDERHLRILLVDSKERVVVMVNAICWTYSKNCLNINC